MQSELVCSKSAATMCMLHAAATFLQLPSGLSACGWFPAFMAVTASRKSSVGLVDSSHTVCTTTATYVLLLLLLLLLQVSIRGVFVLTREESVNNVTVSR
jgi:hypothetical protein